MSTITPTSDQRQTFNHTSFQVGDTVQSKLDSRIGTVVTPDGLIPTMVLLPTPHIVLLPVPLPPVPLGTPAPPLTQNVKVVWSDRTFSVVPLSTLRRAP